MATLEEAKQEYVQLIPPPKPKSKNHRTPNKLFIPVKDTPVSKWRWMVIKIR